MMFITIFVMQVSQSHDLLAEILQLSSTLPTALQSSGGKYGPILFDFRFFRDPDAHEQKIEASQELTDLDEEFREVWTPRTTLPHALSEQRKAYTSSNTCLLRASIPPAGLSWPAG